MNDSDEKTGGGRVEDVTILVRSNKIMNEYPRGTSQVGRCEDGAARKA